LGKRLEAGENT